MRPNDKAAGRFVRVLLAGLLAVSVLYFSGWAAVAKNVVVLAWRGNTMVALAKRTPFAPPSGGVGEQRLKAYLAVLGRIKPFGDKIDDWEAANAETNQGRKFSFKGRAAGLVEAYLHEFTLALEQQRMGPAEFAWIEGRMRQVVAPALEPAPEADRVLYAKYRDHLAALALGPHGRRIALGFAE